jgi:hypothetical protein
MAKRQSVDDLYRDRSFPNGQVRGRHPLPPRDSGYSRHEEIQKNQAPEDRHASNYSNDCSGWVRGARGQPTRNNETAENKPSGFDKGQSYRRADKGDDWGSGHDPAIIRKPERNVP